VTVDAAGPEIVTYAELVQSVAIAVRRRPQMVNLPPGLVLAAGSVVGLFMRDILLTRQELEGLMQGLLVSHEQPRGTRRVDDWLLRSAHVLGRSYASELGRHFR
jgi:NADH dehydrogenase